MGTLTLPKLQKWAKGNTFIETGSMEGWTMLVAVEYGFETMHGIELIPEYYNYSLNLLKDYPNVHFWLGESPDILPSLVGSLEEPATIWLDAHASGPNILGGKYGGCPLVQELKAIESSPCKEHLLLIDDVRLLGSNEWDFVSKDQVLEAIYKINPSYKITYIDGEDDGSFPEDILVAYV